MPAVSVKDLHKTYGSHEAVRGIDFEIEAGEVFGLLGPNGAGKTTLLRATTGLIRPMRGRVTFDGEDVTGRKPHYVARRGLCLLPEGRGIFPSLTVHDNLVLQSPKGRESECIEQSVAAFPILGTRLRQLAASLSGGEQQMLALARSFTVQPKLVLVDEASLGLAPMLVDKIFDTLRRLALTGVSLLIVEQYVTRALELADTVYLLNRGQVAFHGRADVVPGDELFRRYLGVEMTA
jgi:branched-chain amino acid transport system ATP-binding protein